MASTKAALKAAKAFIDNREYLEAIEQAKAVISKDARNYHANVFLGLAFDRLGKPENAVESYRTATAVKGSDPLAWQGLIGVYESHGNRYMDEYRDAVLQLAKIYQELDDSTKCQKIIDNFLVFVKANGNRIQNKSALELLIPSSPIYDFLEGRIPPPATTFIALAEIFEAEEKERINKEIGVRRTRLGATISNVTADVKREVYSSSSLEEIYQNIINYSNDDEVRREYEEKLLLRAYDTLAVLPAGSKGKQQKKVQELARGIVILKHPYQLAWNLTIEWEDRETIREWDLGLLHQFIEFFPGSGLSKVLKGYLHSEISPFAVSSTDNQAITFSEQPDENGTGSSGALSTEEQLLLMTEGIQDATESVLANRLMSDFYLHLEEFEMVVEMGRHTIELIALEAKTCGVMFESAQKAVSLNLATALVYYQAPRNQGEAKALFDKILSQDPTSTPALIGSGLILEEREEYAEAAVFLRRALSRNPTDLRVKSEAAWCAALQGETEYALEELKECMQMLGKHTSKTHELRAQCLYRIGMCIWNLDGSVAARKDRKGSYTYFIDSLKANSNYAPAFSALGIYYADYGKDKRRARKCFQKAFELSTSEVEAAERLARSFANRSEWDLVEAVARRVVDSGRTKRAPGSRKKALSWPHSAIGVVELSKQEYASSIISFQSALRINPGDYHSWVGLGEGYHNSGRYVSAMRAFEQAEKFEKQLGIDTWFAHYMSANVRRELGDFEEAIKEYNTVLHVRQHEYGVLVALMQTLVDFAWRSVHLGFLGRGVELAASAIEVASRLPDGKVDSFNVWKALGDACAVFSSVQSSANKFPIARIGSLLSSGTELEDLLILGEDDGLDAGDLSAILPAKSKDAERINVVTCLATTILSFKRAILSSKSDVHARAVAWYNLGWAENTAYLYFVAAKASDSTKIAKYRKAAIRCFKHAIELEAGNSEFWNALGVMTIQVSPRVSQHSFVRSLFLNDKSAQAWTNLGALYILQNDLPLANEALTRAQSTDPTYALAWLGQGQLARFLGDSKEALALFTHAHEIADSSSLSVNRQYSLSVFDSLVQMRQRQDPSSLIGPVQSLRQIHSQRPEDISSLHVSALFSERLEHYTEAMECLNIVLDYVENEYEKSESSSSLAYFAQVKADLARVELASNNHLRSLENAEMSLNLSSESDTFDSISRPKLRLSAHLSCGLASYFLGDMDTAFDMFQTALEESDRAADVICLLAQVLWVKNEDKERAIARENLFDSIQTYPKHVRITILLAVIAALDKDEEALEAVVDDMHALRSRGEIRIEERRTIDKVLILISSLKGGSSNSSVDELLEISVSLLLSPSNPQGWRFMAALTGEQVPKTMAIKTAQRCIPPGATLDAETLAITLCEGTTVAEMQTAIVIAPWIPKVWKALGEMA